MPIGTLEEYHEIIGDVYDLPMIVFRNLRKYSNEIFLVDAANDVQVTFGEVLADSVRWAIAMKELNVQERSLVAFVTETSIEAIKCKIGVWLAGGGVCLLNYNVTSDALAQLLETSTADFIFCQSSKLEHFGKAIAKSEKKFTVFTDKPHDKYINVCDLGQNIPEETLAEFSVQQIDPLINPTYVLFTSGTTGAPKGVLTNSYSTLTNAARSFKSSKSVFVTATFYGIMCPISFVYAILNGGRFIYPGLKFIPGTNKEDGHFYLRCIEKYKPEKWFTNPATAMDVSYAALEHNYDLSCFTAVCLGGYSFPVAQRKFINEALFKKNLIQDRYGSTEMGVLTSEWDFAPLDYNNPKAASFGPLSPGVQVKIVDVHTQKELGPNQEGEIVARSQTNFRKYVNKDRPEVYTKNDWYHSGDLGYYDEDGWLYFKSRLKDLIKYRNNSITPTDIEKVIMGHPNVLDVGVVGVPHPVDGERPAVFVVKKPGLDITEDEVSTLVSEKLMDYHKLRGGIFFLEVLPKNTNGKVLRDPLIAEAIRRGGGFS